MGQGARAGGTAKAGSRGAGRAGGDSKSRHSGRIARRGDFKRGEVRWRNECLPLLCGVGARAQRVPAFAVWAEILAPCPINVFTETVFRYRNPSLCESMLCYCLL